MAELIAIDDSFAGDVELLIRDIDAAVTVLADYLKQYGLFVRVELHMSDEDQKYADQQSDD